MRYEGKRVLVTGAGGFVGSHLAEALVREGAEVRALFRYRSENGEGWLKHSELFRCIKPFYADLTDRDSLTDAVRETDVVFHLGAQISVPYSFQAPELFVSTNVLGTLNLLRAIRQFCPYARLIHTSTSEVYGSAQYTPMDEMHPKIPRSPYAASKVGADAIVTAGWASWGGSGLILRPFNTYGPRQSARAVLPAIILQALVRPLKSDGPQQIRLGALTPRRDLVYVDDSVEAYLVAGLSAENYRMVNICTGKSYSVAELVDLVAMVMGKDLVAVQDGQRFRPARAEVDELCGNRARAFDLLAWEPKTELPKGLMKIVSWFSLRPQDSADCRPQADAEYRV